MALETSPTKCTGSLWSGGLSSPSWLLVRAQISVFALVLQESLHWLLLRLTSDTFPVFLFVYVCKSECVCVCVREAVAVQTGPYSIIFGEENMTALWFELILRRLVQTSLQQQRVNWKMQTFLEMPGCDVWQRAKILFVWTVPIWTENVSSGHNRFLWWTEFLPSMHLRMHPLVHTACFLLILCILLLDCCWPLTLFWELSQNVVFLGKKKLLVKRK